MDKEPVRELTPAEIGEMIYYKPKRPAEGADANWVRCTLNSMARYKELQIGPSDWFERDEVERWVSDFGPDAILNAFREFLVNGSLSQNDQPLQSFRAFICMLCKSGVSPLESAFYSKGMLREARMKELGLGRNNEQPQA